MYTPVNGTRRSKLYERVRMMMTDKIETYRKAKIKYTTHNLISIIELISIGLTAMSPPLRYSITFCVCLRFHRNLQW